MSQAGIIDIINTNPTIPTTFIADTGSAVPIANILEILGTSVAAGIVPLRTVGSGNTITIEIQRGQAFASSFSERAGIVSFDSTSFAVDANGFVTFTGGAGTVTSVSGTANRITSTGGTTPVIDISAAYVGQTSITTLGTITTGTWQGSAIGPTFGGTGQTTYATGDILYASAANVLSKLPAGTNTQVLTLAAGVPSWASPASAGVTSVSGTANRITSTGGATPVIDIAATYVGQTSITTLGTITTGVWNGTAIAVTSGGTGLTSTTINQILYSSANNVIGGITAANNGTLISGTTGVPSWLANGLTGQVLTATAGSTPSWAAATGPLQSWVSFTGSTAAILASSNVTSVSRTSAGLYVITWTVAFSNANYTVFICGLNASGPLSYQVTVQTTTTATIETFNSGSPTDLTKAYVTAIGT